MVDSNDNYLNNWHKKSEIERVLLSGLHGAPQLNAEDKQRYLGLNREQVMAFLFEHQVKEAAIYTEVDNAIKDPRAAIMVLNGRIGSTFTDKYKTLATAAELHVMTVFGPEYSPTTGLIVASDSAVDFEKIECGQRYSRLRSLGISDALIKSAGKKVCRKCYKVIKMKAPSETINYRQIRLIDRLTGESCPAHGDTK